ncbi:PadR family transcriptional regulator [Fontibacillus phaseoli]|uniref:PadR family transcriptional regulator n=1 Tax=Fontibacillus phaseoli TaxID=1416533 RepID=A0A369BMD8_9BACL|nr:PadR family transcriptional regulator [Fontibacillus phaseoli]RCX21788.1 PadR family transcriptional regulator [Fontibacillus phaseoli]
MDIEILILAQLMQGPKHGYEIKKNILFVMNNKKIINNNSLYPKLKQFEERGMVSKTMEEQEGRPNRHVYAITAIGSQVFHDTINRFTPELIEMDDEWSIRLAYYNLMNDETRYRLLDYRMTIVQDKEKRLEKLSHSVGESKYLMYSSELYFYTQNMIEKEKELISEMIEQLKDKPATID